MQDQIDSGRLDANAEVYLSDQDLEIDDDMDDFEYDEIRGNACILADILNF